MPSQPMATWITPWSSRSVNVAGTRTRRHTIGLMPISQTLTCRTVVASAAGSEGDACRGRRASAVVSSGQIIASQPDRRRTPQGS